ncbi:hypothetical protein KY347_05605 [Candidatus Woesearchaeota archaeon]|nr:hypothetical protein [Candidatus Woesearchaeota archaeon]
MDLEESPIYRNFVSHIDINRSVNSIEYFNFRDINTEPKFNEFLNDMNLNNDAIELSLIKNRAYKEAVVMSLNQNIGKDDVLADILRSEQKTFGGSKLFYLNDGFDKLLVVSVPRSMEGKLNMVINRLNRINEKITRHNLRVKKENFETYMRRQELKDKKDFVVNMINKNLRV